MMNSHKRYVVLTPFDKAEVVAGIARIRGIEADVVSTGSGVALVRDIPVPEFTDWDIAELLGDIEDAAGNEAPVPQSSPNSDIDADNPRAVAAVFSELSPYGVVLLEVELGDDVGGEDGVSGVVHAQRVIAGKPGEVLPAGLILNSLDPKIEALILGLQPIEEIDPHVIRPSDAEQFLKRSFNDDGGETCA